MGAKVVKKLFERQNFFVLLLQLFCFRVYITMLYGHFFRSDCDFLRNQSLFLFKNEQLFGEIHQRIVYGNNLQDS
jgi:hypothetical protein